MKNPILLFLFVLCSTVVFSSIDDIPVEHIERYQKTPENALLVPTNFAREFILTPEMLKTLEGKRIHHLDLVYTQFRQSFTFDQKELNQNRITQLESLLPQLATDDPSWRMIEQAGAKSVNAARGYFHGFVIHYSDELDYSGLDNFFQPFQVEFTEYIGNNIRENIFNHPTKTVITVHQDAVVNDDNAIVEGDYVIKYREFRNSADVVYSGIPMNYVQDGINYNFSSVGMYEIRAEQDGKVLSLTKPAVIDFNCTKTESGVDFYKMNDETGDWNQIEPIRFRADTAFGGAGGRPHVERRENFHNMVFPEFAHGNWNWSARMIDSNNVQMKFGTRTWRRVQSSIKRDEYWNDSTIENGPGNRIITVDLKDSLRFTTMVDKLRFLWWGPVFVNAIKNKEGRKRRKGRVANIAPVDNDMAATLLAEGADAGHTYPTLVKGLNSPDFGVYNCDQIYRMGKSARMAPNYVDEDGKGITSKHVACVLDLNYQGAFSFHPNNIMCNMEGKNVVLLFTNDHKTYMIEHDAMMSAYNSNNMSPTFKMKDMSETLKSTSDLKKLLDL